MRSTRLVRRASLASCLACFACAAALVSTAHGCDGGDDSVSTPANVAGMSVQPVEWVAFRTEVEMTPEALRSFASGLFGADAQAGKFIKEHEFAPGYFITAAAEPSTPDQSRITVAFDDGHDHPRRALAVAPASFGRGKVFYDVIDAALAKMQADTLKDPAGGEKFLIEYRVASPQGGTLSIGVKGEMGKYSLVLDAGTPRTSLTAGKVGTPAFNVPPTDSIAGTVWFHLSKDDFDFFVNRAYGQGSTGKQNFNDFALVPFEWLRLTVTPQVEQKIVNVGFELLTTDKRRLPIAKAPASISAGDMFWAIVDRNMQTMLDQEKMAPGSSAPWDTPFYYDSPESGGVVQVIAHGEKGSFTIAYAVETPRTALTEVPPFQYVPVEFAPPDPSQTAGCEKLGDPTITLAPKGVFEITFKVSDVILQSPDLAGPLKGPIQCSVFRASEVTVTGPVEGAKSVQDFEVPDADFQAATPPTFTTNELNDGEYQILCAQDIDASGGASNGDPVTIPIGSYTIACNRNPVTVEFAILNPLK